MQNTEKFCIRRTTHYPKPHNPKRPKHTDRCTGHLVTRKEGNYKFYLSSDDGARAKFFCVVDGAAFDVGFRVQGLGSRV